MNSACIHLCMHARMPPFESGACNGSILPESNNSNPRALTACFSGENMVAQQGLFAWFKSSEIGESGYDDSKWVSLVGDFTAHPTSGTAKMSFSKPGHGASAGLRTLKGEASSAYTFGEILADKYTICSLTRYTGSRRGRILTGSRTNWLHDHWRGRAGVAHYDGWLGSFDSRMTPATDWVILCGTSKRLFLRGKEVASRSTHVPGNQAVVINDGPYGRSEQSDWAVAEIITWNRELSEKEIQDASAYLQIVLEGEA